MVRPRHHYHHPRIDASDCVPARLDHHVAGDGVDRYLVLHPLGRRHLAYRFLVVFFPSSHLSNQRKPVCGAQLRRCQAPIIMKNSGRSPFCRRAAFHYKKPQLLEVVVTEHVSRGISMTDSGQFRVVHQSSQFKIALL